MGTNFYWIGKGHNDDIQVHIGKRSAAGLYCWDCGTTLCNGGTGGIHKGTYGFMSECPSCGAEPIREPLTESTAGVELGLTKATGAKKGVRSCSSFTWTLMKHLDTIKRSVVMFAEPIIEDEYGQTYTAQEFLKMLEGCPIQFQSPYEFC